MSTSSLASPAASGETGAPPDAEARAAVAARLTETLFVEAGAGTGKTTSLVGRVTALVREGAEVRRIAAITFTEAAAAELRDRVRRALEVAVAAGEAPFDAPADTDDAALTTLHGFAQRILAEHPLEAGLPPFIEVLDEIQSALVFDERWQQFLDELLDDPSLETILLRGLASGLNLNGLRDIAVLLHDHRDRLDPAASAPPPPGAVNLIGVFDALRAAYDYQDACLTGDDLLAIHVAELREVAARLAASTDELETLEILASRRWTCAAGQRMNWRRADVDDVRAACDAAEAARQAVLATIRGDVLAHLLHALATFTLTTAAERRRAGRLDFHDLLVEARDLLRSRPEVRAALRQRYSHILVDEFQDTDPLQVELAVLIAANPSDIPPRWQDASVEPGRLFFVGDPKQSIYRFRRADIALFLEVQRRLAGRVYHLSANFRSVPGVIAWVNDVFWRLIGEGVEHAQAPYEPLLPVRSPLAGPLPPVVLLGEGVDAPLATVREREAVDLAEAVVRIVEQEGWPVADPDAAGGTRPARLSDVAVLLPTRTTLAQLEDAFDDAGIAYRVESSSLVWTTQEVRDLVAVLQAVDDPTDEVALVTALRSPALGCSDADLVEFRRSGGRWNLRAPCPEPLQRAGHPVCRAMGVLRGLHDGRWWDGVAGLVERVTRELRFFELALAHRRPRDRWRRLRFVIDQALAFEEAGGRNLRDFLAWAEHQADDRARVREPVVPETDDDAVRVLTVHGAKGLEFPIVMLAGLNRVGIGSPPRVLWDGDRPEARLFKGFETSGYAALYDAERDMAGHEQTRLLYVAATRARDHLVVSVHHKAGTSSQAAVLAGLCAEAPHLWRTLGPPLLRLQSPPAQRPPRPDPEVLAARQRWSARRDELLAVGRRAPTIAATAIAGPSEVAPADAALRVDGLDGPWRRGRAGTAVGRAVHAVLQVVDLANPDGLPGLAAAHAAAEGVAALAGQVEALTRAALGAPTVRAAARGRHWRELYVAAPVEGTLLEGFVDLVVEADDGSLVVVDHKTDAVRGESDIASAAARYRLQLGAYALALTATTGRPVSRAVLVFAAAGGREVDVGSLATAMADVRRHLAAAR